MVSVVIAAHNEAAVIGRCLDALLADGLDDLDVTVVANGCTDTTAEVARAHPGVRVIELAQPGKARALNAGDAVAVGFPRVYLDADIPISGAAIRTLAAALEASDGVLAAVPAVDWTWSAGLSSCAPTTRSTAGCRCSVTRCSAEV